VDARVKPGHDDGARRRALSNQDDVHPVFLNPAEIPLMVN
jgi:hypothetical protein